MQSTLPASPKPSKGGFYGVLFPILRKVVQFKFYSATTGWIDIPIMSVVILLANFFTIVAIVGAVMSSNLSPRINVSIKSFGIPDHPAQVHWDAYNAAKSHKFSPNASMVDIPTQSTYFDRGAVRKRRSADPTFPNCDLLYNTQNYIHRNWAMDLVFRVPSETAQDDDNILTPSRISYIHDIEESIYNSTGYGNVCRLHKESGNAFCYPLNSLLSWLYLRDPKTGKYVYDTPDGFTPDLQNTLRTLSNLSVALWFTGGEANFSVDFSFVEAKLLRSQVRVALPLRCFSGPYVGYEEQKALVMEYFVSLIPMLEKMSTR
jgi:hypothetical protein